MTYKEALQLVERIKATGTDHMKAKRPHVVNGCFICTDDDDLCAYFFEECIINGADNAELLYEEDLFSEDLEVFVAYTEDDARYLLPGQDYLEDPELMAKID